MQRRLFGVTVAAAAGLLVAALAAIFAFWVKYPRLVGGARKRPPAVFQFSALAPMIRDAHCIVRAEFRRGRDLTTADIVVAELLEPAAADGPPCPYGPGDVVRAGVPPRVDGGGHIYFFAGDDSRAYAYAHGVVSDLDDMPLDELRARIAAARTRP